MTIAPCVKRILRESPTYRRKVVVSMALDATLTTSQSGAVFTNFDAANRVIASLPATAIDGLEYTFVVEVRQELAINPGPGKAFYFEGSKMVAGEMLASQTIGTSLSVVPNRDGDWVVVDAVGSWGQGIDLLVTMPIPEIHPGSGAAYYFIAPYDCVVTGVTAVYRENTLVTAATLDIKTGTPPATSVIASPFDLTESVDTVRSAALAVSSADRQVSLNGCLALEISITGGDIGGLVVVVALRRA